MISPAVDARWAEAQEFVASLATRIRLRGALLDRWSGVHRIVYDAPCVDRCPPDCGQCGLFQAVEGHRPLDADGLVTALVPASESDLEFQAAGQRQLNCKTFDQYLEYLVEWIVACCHTRPEIEAALERVRDFRLLCMDGVSDFPSLERATKRIVVRESIVRLGAHDDRALIVAGAARHLGLLG